MELRANADIWTYQDIVEHLLDMFQEERLGRPLRTARRAAREALRELHMSHRWSYYNSEGFFRTVAQQTTGTIEYDHTGGASERLVTLSDATWPTEAKLYRIIIADTHYDIATYESSTTITLSATNNPGADVAAATSYKIYREAYELPTGFGELGTLIDVTNNRVVPVIGTDTQVTTKYRSYETPQTPWHVSIRNSGEYLNSMAFVFVPPPDSAIKYRYTYTRSPRVLATEKNDDGTAAATTGDYDIVVTNGTMASKHVGCIMRLGNKSNPPTSAFGGLDDIDNPFTDQGVILAISGGTATLDRAVTNTYAGVKFTISDPIDVEINTMLTAYQRICESRYSILNKREMKERREREGLAQLATRLAKERDNRTVYSPTYAPYDPFTRVSVTDDDD